MKEDRQIPWILWDWPIELFSCEQALPSRRPPQRQFKDYQGCHPQCSQSAQAQRQGCCFYLGLREWDGTHTES